MAGTTKANNGVIALNSGKRSLRRKLLMASVVALAPAAAGLALADSMQGGCVYTPADATTTCTGNQAINGVEIYNGDTLIVRSLIDSIGASDEPLYHADAGVDFDHYPDGKLDATALTLDVDTTGTSGIWVAYGDGIEVENEGQGTTSVKSKGAISVFNDDGYSVSGIAVHANTGKVDVTSSSAITLTTDGGEDPTGGILVDSSGDIKITNTGMIVATKTGDYYGDVAGIGATTAGLWGGYANAGQAGGEVGMAGGNGGDGVDGSQGGKIDVVSTAGISTSGAGTAGIAADSTGGDGGQGGQGGDGATGYTSLTGVGGDGGNGGAGGNGGSGGAGGAITVVASGAITSAGANSAGIYALSQGGSGGAGRSGGQGGNGGLGGEIGMEGEPGFNGADGVNGNGGDGGTVTVTSSAAIDVSGDGAAGIQAESSGGRAGKNSGWGGAGGDVHVNNSGVITTDGPGATGISVASLGGEMGSLTVTNSGTITSTQNDDPAAGVPITAGVAFEGGYNNELNNSGTIDTAGIFARSGPRFAVTALGETTINNTGTINGSIDLMGLAPALIDTFTSNYNTTSLPTPDASTYEDFLSLLHMNGNAFNNTQGGTFNAGILVALGEGNTLTNSGNLTAGGDVAGLDGYLGAGFGTFLIGNLDQTATGKMNVNLDVGNSSANAFYVLGTVNLGGTIVVTPNNLSADGFNTPVVYTFGLGDNQGSPHPMTTAGITNDGVALLASPALHADLQLSYSEVSIGSEGINYGAVAGLTAAEQQVADHVQAQFEQEYGDNKLKTAAKVDAANNEKLFLALLTPMELAQYKAALDQLTPTAGASSGSASTNTSSQFTNAMLSCRQATGAYAYIREGQCSWAQLKQRVTDRSLTVDAPGSRAYVTSLSAGVQKSIGKGWFAGFGLGFAHDDISNTDRASSSGNEAMAGVVVKYAPGPISLALALDAGMGWNDNKRSITLLNETATASNTQNHLGAQLRAAYLLDHGLWYAKPMVDFNATLLNIGGYTETGSSSNLVVLDSKNTILSLSPAIEFGGQFKLANGALVRPYTKLGVTVFGATSIGTTAHLVGTTGDFNVSSSGDRTLLDLTGGLDILATDGITLRLNAESHFGATTRDVAASAKVGWSF